MKALFYRTFYVNQGSTLPAFLIILLFCILPLPWLTSIFLPVLMGSLPMLFLLQRDQKDRWYDLAPMLPLSPLGIGEREIFPGRDLCPVLSLDHGFRPNHRQL